jgi:hypothetical protein
VTLVEQFELQGAEEALGHRVVIRVADRAHGTQEPGGSQAPAEGPRGVWDP